MFTNFLKKKKDKKKDKEAKDSLGSDKTNDTVGTNVLKDGMKTLKITSPPDEITEPVAGTSKGHRPIVETRSYKDADKRPESKIRSQKTNSAPKPPIARPPPQVAKLNDRVTTEALRVLEAVGMTHKDAMEKLYLARVLQQNEAIYDNIMTYIENGQVHGYKLNVCTILRLVRENDIEFQHQKDKSEEFRLLLWHGTSKGSIVSILQNGFRLPVQNGQMFGPGIYFADRISKSANYCETDMRTGTRAYILLCDVLLGKVYNARNPHTEFTEAPNGTTRSFNSVKCTGRYISDWDEKREFNGSILPCGETVENRRFEDYTVHFNEFIVYSTENIKIMFMVEVEFVQTPVSGENDHGRDAHNRDVALAIQRFR